MPLHLPEDLRTDLVICGLSGKRYTGVRELHDILKPLVLEGKVSLVPKDGLCSPEALNRYIKWARATFFIRVEAPDSVRSAKGWRAEFGPEDHVRDEHWTETALDDWDGWDAVIHNDGDEDTLLAHANDLAPRINALVKNPELSKHKLIPDHMVRKTEQSTPIPACMVPGWGVNPPTKNQQGTYDFNARDSQPPPAERVQQAAKAKPQAPAKQENAALKAATARAATAAVRWEGETSKREEMDRSKQEGGAHVQSLDAAKGRDESDEMHGTTGTSSGRGRLSEASGEIASPSTGQPGTGAASSSSTWGGWGSWDAASSTARQRSSSRGRWEERRDAWEDTGSGWGGKWSWAGGDSSRGSQAWSGRKEEVLESEATPDAGGWGSNWSGARSGWGGASWGNWS